MFRKYALGLSVVSVLASATPVLATQYFSTIVTDLNDNGLTVGDFFMPTGQSRGFTYDNGVYQKIIYPGSADTNIVGVNNSGEIVGSWSNGPNNGQFTYKNGVFTALPNTFSATGIDDKGDIVGNYLVQGASGASYVRGGILSGTTLTPINDPTLAPNGNEFLEGISSDGKIVGLIENPKSTYGFEYDNGAFTTLPIDPAGINDSGVLISDTTSLKGPFIYSGGVKTYITLPGTLPWLVNVSGINDAGEVGGSIGVPTNNFQHGFVGTPGDFQILTYFDASLPDPVPEPGVWMTLLLGLGMLGGVTRWRSAMKRRGREDFRGWGTRTRT